MLTERVKGGWHLGGLLFALGACSYNLCRALDSGDSRHRLNVYLYGFLSLVEVEQVIHHGRRA